MAVHAHPDDEVFSTGGILARYAAEGHRVVVVYATRGEAGEVQDPDLNPDEVRHRLGQIREQEARDACALLGVTDVFFLGYRDSGMVDTEENHNSANFHNAPLDEAAGRLQDIMRKTKPDVVVTYDSGGGYGHPDHIMTNKVATEAFTRSQEEPWAARKLYYTSGSREGFRQFVEYLTQLGLKVPWLDRVENFSFDEYGTPNADITAHIDVGLWAPLKKRALAIHRTQIHQDFFYSSIPDDGMKAAAGIEYFMRIFPPSGKDEHEDDLFADLESRTTAVEAALFSAT